MINTSEQVLEGDASFQNVQKHKNAFLFFLFCDNEITFNMSYENFFE